MEGMRFGINFFGIYTLLFSFCFSVGFTISAYAMSGAILAIVIGVLSTMSLIASAIDYVIPKTIIYSEIDGKLYLKYLILIEVDKNRALVRKEEIFNYSRASREIAIILYLDRAKIGSITIKNKIRLIGGISEDKAKMDLDMISSLFGLSIINDG